MLPFAGPYAQIKLGGSPDAGGEPLSPGAADAERVASQFSTDGCTEDPMGYLEPVKIRITDSFFDGDGINSDLSLMEGSVVDSDYLMDYCKKPASPTPAINVEKYKIRKPDPSRLSAVSNDTRPGEFTESELSDGSLLRMTEKERALYSENEYEELPLAPPPPVPLSKTVSEENFANKLDNDSETLKRNLLQRDAESPSLNDLNKENSSGGSNNSLCLSTPNIKYKTDTLRSEDSNNTAHAAKNSPTKRSLPSLPCSSAESSGHSTPSRTSPAPVDKQSIDKIKKALDTDNGVIDLYHGKTNDKRFSKATEDALRVNHVRYSSSDC